ncbi:hypothetical protein C9374_009698 [Naegleria lovaniensis]|uniref:BTB domain-containing protein n=1 Tax=Naegleria lovaniensis TaxID=51637 RepID=A0AA88H3C8_NAELO|nr:uncharacterized protein C9374_009698 [Naegleria lovaniensis]KAG2393121.1 hypothetical protein C9374_009698 [Naegleria lovaniensis]
MNFSQFLRSNSNNNNPNNTNNNNIPNFSTLADIDQQHDDETMTDDQQKEMENIMQPSIPFRMFTEQEQTGQVPSQRSQIALVACPPRHSLFCLGGVVDKPSNPGSVLQVYEFDLRTGVWKQHLDGTPNESTTSSRVKVANLWSLKACYRRADHHIWCFGGNTESTLSSFMIRDNIAPYGVFCLDLNTFKWKTKLDRIGKLNWRRATKTDGYPFRLPENQTTASKLGEKRYGHAMEMMNDQSKFIVFGGDNGSGLELNDLIEFDFRDLLWRPVEVVAGKAPLMRHVLCSAITNSDKFFIFGGRCLVLNAADTSLQSLAYFDFTCKTWFNIEINYTFPSARFALAFSAFQAYGKPNLISKHSDVHHNYESYYEYLCMHGGRNDGHRFNDTYIYNIEEERWISCKLVDDSIGIAETLLEQEKNMQIITLSKERKMKRKELSSKEIIYRGGNIGQCISYNDINFKSSSLFYDYSLGMTTFSMPMVSQYPTLSLKFINFGGKTGFDTYTVYDSSLLTFDLTFFNYQNDPSLLVDPTKSASTDACLEELSVKLWAQKQFKDYSIVDDSNHAIDCHRLVLVKNNYFNKMIQSHQYTTDLKADHLDLILKFCYGIELTPRDASLSYHVHPTLDFDLKDKSMIDFIDLYSVVFDIQFLELLDYLRKLLTVTMTIEMAIKMFKELCTLLQSKATEPLNELIGFCADYLRFTVLPEMEILRDHELEIFLSSNNFSLQEGSLFHSLISSSVPPSFNFKSYVKKRVMLAREYMHLNLIALMSHPEDIKLTTFSNIVVRLDDEASFEIVAPSALLSLRFDYFNNLIFNKLFSEYQSDIELPMEVFYQPHAIHPLLNVAVVLYYAYTNDVALEKVLACKHVFPTQKNGCIHSEQVISHHDEKPHTLKSPQQVEEITQDILIQYIIDIYSLADFLASLSMKESILKYVRRLIATEKLGVEKVTSISQELASDEITNDLLSEISEMFRDCADDYSSLQKQEERKAKLFVKPPLETLDIEYFEEEEE